MTYRIVDTEMLATLMKQAERNGFVNEVDITDIDIDGQHILTDPAPTENHESYVCSAWVKTSVTGETVEYKIGVLPEVWDVLPCLEVPWAVT